VEKSECRQYDPGWFSSAGTNRGFTGENRMSRRIRIGGIASIAALVVVALLAFAPIAAAQDSGNGQVAVVSKAAPAAPGGDASGVPFTGLDAALLLSGAFVLLGAGAAIARLVPRSEGL
jgi:hypothetical protein